MKNGIFWAWVILLYLATSTVVAEPLHPRRILTKISLKIRGHLPSTAEFEQFEALLNSQPDRITEHIGGAIDSFMGSQAYTGQLELHHALWWGMPISESIELAAYLATNELSHLEVLDHSFLILDQNSGSRYFRQYGLQTPDELPSSSDPSFIRIGQGEHRFRSLLDSLDFLETYPDTDTNKNRTRSSFVYRALLCQSLVPDTDMAAQIPASDTGDHGSQPECYGCHVRLDPLARFFDQWAPPIVGTLPNYLPEQAIAGELIYRDRLGAVKRHPHDSMIGFSRSLAASETVQRCFAKQGWRFAHGVAAEPDQTTEDMLLATFRQRYALNDVVKASMLHEYFWTSAEPPPIKYSQISEAFAVCSDCHSESGGQYPILDVMNYPFRADARQNKWLLRTIWLEINGNGATSGMPLYPIPAIDEVNMARIRQWIEDGAHTDDGQATLDDAAVTEVLSDN